MTANQKGLGKYKNLLLWAFLGVSAVVIYVSEMNSSQKSASTVSDAKPLIRIGKAYMAYRLWACPNIQDLPLVLQIARSDDNEAIARMELEGRVYRISKPTKVYVTDVKSWDNAVQIRPEGLSDTLWVPQEALRDLGT